MPPRSALPHFLTGLCTLLVVHASLQPFSGWLPPAPGTPFFLWAPWPRFNLPDVLINIVAYAPLGIAATWTGGRDTSVGRAALRAIAWCALLSLAMEWAQMYLPLRRASAIDSLANVFGAVLGAGIAAAIMSHPHWRRRLRQWREAAFLGGRLGDFGLTMLVVWWVMQVNPAIALFAATFQPDVAVATDHATVMLEAAQTGLNFLGVLLFVALLLRRREYFGVTAVLFIVAALTLKAGAAALLLKSAPWDHWLRPGAGIGIAAGALALLVAVWLPQRARMIVCAVALLSSLFAAVLMPDLLFAQASLARFDWNYGHLLNFNGLTRTVLLVWPVFAALHLLVLFGRR
ncbi:MAG: VanZ family protein [Betaproteobacteria bacterium]|nr:VanZ family protein [Betaproteobacteria bacterium]